MTRKLSVNWRRFWRNCRNRLMGYGHVSSCRIINSSAKSCFGVSDGHNTSPTSSPALKRPACIPADGPARSSGSQFNSIFTGRCNVPTSFIDHNRWTAVSNGKERPLHLQPFSSSNSASGHLMQMMTERNNCICLRPAAISSRFSLSLPFPALCASLMKQLMTASGPREQLMDFELLMEAQC